MNVVFISSEHPVLPHKLQSDMNILSIKSVRSSLEKNKENMIDVLIIFTGILISFWSFGILYSLGSSNLLRFQEQDTKFNLDSYRVTTKYNMPRTNCYDIVVRCPDEEEAECNCVRQCGVGFQDAFVLPNSQTILNGQMLEPGRYCLPRETVPCDKRLGYLIYSNGKFVCHCKHPDIFGGPMCNERRNCFRGLLRHTKTKALIGAYNIPNDDDYFCSCDVLDEDGNVMVNLPGDPLECLKDPCKKWLRGHEPEVGLNPETGDCSCGKFTMTRVKNQFLDNLKSPCTSCFITTNENETVLPFRCASKNSHLSLATPCRDFDLVSECERVPVRLKFTDFTTFQEIGVTMFRPPITVGGGTAL